MTELNTSTKSKKKKLQLTAKDKMYFCDKVDDSTIHIKLSKVPQIIHHSVHL